uniref:Protein kinase domain-containing protein n=1 Tax=Plectus sambesii TaxID=2011161 RepID=A0A914XCU3_9BILA
MSGAQGIDFELADREEFMDFIKVASYSGLLLHFQEAVRDIGNEWYYFDPAWLSRAILLVLNAKMAVRKLAISEAVQCLCDGLSIDESCALGVVEVMQRFELLMKLDETQLLVPHNLPKEGPELDIRLTDQVVCRIYRMTITPPGFWTRLVARLLNQFNNIPTTDPRLSQTQCHFFTPHRFVRCRKNWTMYWANGIYLKSDKGMLKVESLQTSRIATCIPENVEGVLISWHWMGDPDFTNEPYFGMAVDEVELLISKWFFESESGFDRVQRLVVCSKCAETIFDEQKLLSSASNQISCFPLEQLTAILTESTVVKCQFHEEVVALSDMIPDLLLCDIDGLPRNTSELEYSEKLGGGGQAVVLRAHTFDKREIAAKVFFASEEFVREKSTSFSKSLQAIAAAARARQLLYQKSSLTQITEDSDGSGLKSVTLNSINTLDSARKNTDLELRTVRGLRNMRREACILSALSHPLVIGLCGVTFEPNQPFCLMLEFAPQGNLLNYIFQKKMEVMQNEFHNSNHDLSDREQGIIFYGIYIDRYLLYKISWQIAIALEYLHEANVIYKDLKAENVLMWSDDPSVKVNIKLSDYGISCRADPQGQIGGEGTRGYQAPELLNNMMYDEKVDVYSYGMILYELLTARQPFFDVSFAADIDRMVKIGRRPSLKDALVKTDFVAVSDLMERCWSRSASNRPSASNLRRQLETLTFFSLRHRVEIEMVNMSSMEQQYRQIFIVPCRPESNLVCLISKNIDMSYCVSILNTLTGEMIEHDKDALYSSKHEGENAMPAAVCHSNNAIIILFGPHDLPDTMQFFRINANSLLPLPTFLHELPIPSEHAEESMISAICAAQISDDIQCVTVGFESGKIIAYKASVTVNDADFVSSTTLRSPTLTPISALAAFESPHFCVEQVGNHKQINYLWYIVKF